MQVEIWSDVVCPWCFIGKRRFETALGEFRKNHPEVQVDVSYRAFQLDPGAPIDRDELVQEVYEKKFGGKEQADLLIDRVTTEAAGEGLEFHMDIARRSNTARAHRLLALAEAKGLQLALKERLMQAYFSEGQPIGDVSVLVSLGAEVGLDREESLGWLSGDGGKAEVVEQLEFAAQAGIQSVPTYVINREVGIPGAQPPEAFLEVLEKMALQSQPSGSEL